MLNLIFSNNFKLVFVAIIILVLSLFAAEAANKSFFEERNKLMGWPSIIGYFMAGLIPLIIYFITKTWFLLYLLLQVGVTFLQFKNQEGKKRAHSWNLYSWICIILSIFSYANYLDKGHVLSPIIILVGAIISLLPHIVGTGRTLYLDDQEYYDSWVEKFQNSKIATVVLIIVAILMVLLMITTLVGLLS